MIEALGFYLYVLDDKLRPDDLIDDYISLIWTDRETSWGDFELTIRATEHYRRTLRVDTRLSISQSDRLMVIESILDHINSDGARVLKVKGRSIEALLDSRIARQNMNGLTNTPVWTFNAKPQDICRTIVQQVCVTGVLSSADVIPYLTVPTWVYNPEDIPEPVVNVKMDIEPNSVYNVIKDITESYNLSWKIEYSRGAELGDPGRLRFQVYTGRDRTSRNYYNVIFAKELDNLSNVSELKTIENRKTVAYVFSKNGSRTVYAPGFSASVGSGMSRKVMYVKSDSELAAGVDLQAELLRLGLEVLSANIGQSILDGTSGGPNAPGYMSDYSIGDLVEVRGFDGNIAVKKTTEHTYTSDSTGIKSVPTMIQELFIEPGTWGYVDPDLVWSAATGTWAEA